MVDWDDGIKVDLNVVGFDDGPKVVGLEEVGRRFGAVVIGALDGFSTVRLSNSFKVTPTIDPYLTS